MKSPKQSSPKAANVLMDTCLRPSNTLLNLATLPTSHTAARGCWRARCRLSNLGLLSRRRQRRSRQWAFALSEEMKLAWQDQRLGLFPNRTNEKHLQLGIDH